MRKRTLAERFWAKVSFGMGENACWTWKGFINPSGYGKCSIDIGEQIAHRAAFRLLGGEIPEGAVLHHTCGNRACVRHLEVFANNGEHTRMHKGLTHCQRGHEFNEKNTYVRKNGTRWCLRCSYWRKAGRPRLETA